MAATDTNPEIVELLLENGADPNVKTSDGATPLHCAFQYCCFEVAKLLILGGADINAVTEDGQTPFEVSPVDGTDIKPFTATEIEELKGYANSSSKVLVTSNGDKSKAKLKGDENEDFEEMRKFFKSAGLGSAEAKLCAVESVNRGAKTSKKLAVMIKMNLFTLDDLMVSSRGSNESVLDDLDYELVNIALTSISQQLYFVADDGPINSPPFADISRQTSLYLTGGSNGDE